MAVGIQRAARDRGIDVPAALSVIGVDDIPLATHFEPPLTTVRQDFAAIGGTAARLLIRALEEPGANRTPAAGATAGCAQVDSATDDE